MAHRALGAPLSILMGRGRSYRRQEIRACGGERRDGALSDGRKIANRWLSLPTRPRGFLRGAGGYFSRLCNGVYRMHGNPEVGQMKATRVELVTVALAALAFSFLPRVDSAEGARTEPTSPPVAEPERYDPTDIAMKLFLTGRGEAARAVLSDFVEHMPADWTATKVIGNRADRYYWDIGDFTRCSPADQTALKVESIAWRDGPSYSKAYFLLGYIAVAEHKSAEALPFLDQAIRLEPDAAMALSEKGQALLGMGRPQDALESFRAAAKRSCAGEKHVARALRGQGVSLVELGRLDEAETVLNQSLELEPGHPAALQELRIIQRARGGERVPGMILRQ